MSNMRPSYLLHWCFWQSESAHRHIFSSGGDLGILSDFRQSHMQLSCCLFFRLDTKEIKHYENPLLFALVLLAINIGTLAHFQQWQRPKDFVKLSTITYAVITLLLILSTRY